MKFAFIKPVLWQYVCPYCYHIGTTKRLITLNNRTSVKCVKCVKCLKKFEIKKVHADDY